jgi:hypothetical protein
VIFFTCTVFLEFIQLLPTHTGEPQRQREAITRSAKIVTIAITIGCFGV